MEKELKNAVVKAILKTELVSIEKDNIFSIDGTNYIITISEVSE